MLTLLTYFLGVLATALALDLAFRQVLPPKAVYFALHVCFNTWL